MEAESLSRHLPVLGLAPVCGGKGGEEASWLFWGHLGIISYQGAWGAQQDGA